MERKRTSLSEPQLTRRELFQLLAVIPFALRPQPEPGKENDRTSVHMVREELNLRATGPSKPDVQAVNAAWEQFADKEVASPDVLEGVFTRFGNSADAIEQFIIVTDQLRFLMKRRELTKSPFRQIDYLFALRDRLDAFESGILTAEYRKVHPISSLDFSQASKRFFQQEQLDGIVAMKATQDFGVTGNCYVWNHIEERFAGPFRVVVMNTSDGRTFSHLKNLVGSYAGVEMRWVIELSSDVLEKSCIPIHRPVEDNTAGFARFVADSFFSQHTVAFPTYDAAVVPVTPEFSDMARSIERALRSESFRANIETWLATKPETFDYTVNLAQSEERSVNFDAQSLLPWLVAHAQIPVFLNGSNTAILDAVNGKDSALPAGMPLGTAAQYTLFRRLYEAGHFHRAILSTGRKDAVNPQRVSIFYLEMVDTNPKNTHFLESGILYLNSKGAMIAAYFNEKGALVQEPFDEIQQRFLDRAKDEDALARRFIIYS